MTLIIEATLQLILDYYNTHVAAEAIVLFYEAHGFIYYARFDGYKLTPRDVRITVSSADKYGNRETVIKINNFAIWKQRAIAKRVRLCKVEDLDMSIANFGDRCEKYFVEHVCGDVWTKASGSAFRFDRVPDAVMPDGTRVQCKCKDCTILTETALNNSMSDNGIVTL